MLRAAIKQQRAGEWPRNEAEEVILTVICSVVCVAPHTLMMRESLTWLTSAG